MQRTHYRSGEWRLYLKLLEFDRGYVLIDFIFYQYYKKHSRIFRQRFGRGYSDCRLYDYSRWHHPGGLFLCVYRLSWCAGGYA